MKKVFGNMLTDAKYKRGDIVKIIINKNIDNTYRQMRKCSIGKIDKLGVFEGIVNYYVIFKDASCWIPENELKLK